MSSSTTARLPCTHKTIPKRYGKSEGTPTEEGLILDVEASLRALKESPKSRVDLTKLILFGRSLGGAVALAAADRYPDVVRHSFCFFYIPSGSQGRT